MIKHILPFFLSLFLIAFPSMIFAQQGKTIENQTPDTTINKDSTNNYKLHATMPFTLELSYIGQYMQSVQLVFTLTNNSGVQLNNFWLHVSLLNKNKGFLYREQPALFSEIKPSAKQSIEILCESVGLEEIGFVVLHPQLLEKERTEQIFETENVELIQPSQSDARMVFNSSIR